MFAIFDFASGGGFSASGGRALFSKFAEGGIVTQPTMAMIGEAGEAEAVIPLSKLSNMVAGGGGRGSQSIYIELDGRTIGKSVMKNAPDIARVYAR